MKASIYDMARFNIEHSWGYIVGVSVMIIVKCGYLLVNMYTFLQGCVNSDSGMLLCGPVCDGRQTQAYLRRLQTSLHPNPTSYILYLYLIHCSLNNKQTNVFTSHSFIQILLLTSYQMPCPRSPLLTWT